MRIRLMHFASLRSGRLFVGDKAINDPLLMYLWMTPGAEDPCPLFRYLPDDGLAGGTVVPFTNTVQGFGNVKWPSGCCQSTFVVVEFS
jgi:hypothetical protein